MITPTIDHHMLDIYLRRKIKLKVFILLMSIVLLTGCATTKIVKVPVPVPCAKPKLLPKPRDYMADLKPDATPPEFVKACLATRMTCNNFYEAYTISRGND